MEDFNQNNQQDFSPNSEINRLVTNAEKSLQESIDELKDPNARPDTYRVGVTILNSTNNPNYLPNNCDEVSHFTHKKNEPSKQERDAAAKFEREASGYFYAVTKNLVGLREEKAA